MTKKIISRNTYYFFSYNLLVKYMNKYKIFFIILLSIFSFYYTNQVINIIRNSDPIMKDIKKNSAKFSKKALDASIEGNYIIPGVNGIKVDNNKSYSKMKNYGKYNENLLVFKEEEPVISVDDVYDKFMVSGNSNKREVSLIFIIRRDDDISSLLNILLQNNVNVTFFMDGLFIENNQDLVKDLVDNNHEVEILSYNGNYQRKYFREVINILEELTNKKANYCYTEYSNKEVLNLCRNLSLHTIIPSINIKKRPYNTVKEELKNGSIISLLNNDYIIGELSTTIKYIKQKGYSIVTLEELLNEESEETTEE